MSRYSRQERFAPIGANGQQQLSQARVLVCGCGALGSMIAERLARAGVGAIRLVDRDWVELSNLQRQTLFTEHDAELARPKAVAAAEHLARINSQLEVEGVVEDLSFETIAGLARDCQLILDGTDNFETRFLLNDYCVAHHIPWVHGGCLGGSGQVLSVLPGETACFRCLVPELPPREALETCDSAGVLGPAVGLIACLQAAEALKILSGNRDAVCRRLMVVDTWSTDLRLIALAKHAACPACGAGNFPFLNGQIRSEAAVLCGKNAVQVISPGAGQSSLPQLAVKLRSLGSVDENAYYVRLKLPDYCVTIFRGGRTVVEGTTLVHEAKNVLSRTLGL